MAGDDRDDLASLDIAALLDAYVENVRMREEAGHVGRHNRLASKQSRIVDALKTRGDGTLSALLPLLGHDDPRIRYMAALNCRDVDRAAAQATLRELAARKDKVGRSARDSLEWQERYGSDPARTAEPRPLPDSAFRRTRSDPPRGKTFDDLRHLLFDRLSPDRAKAILELARPAIVLWPQRMPADAPPTVSHIGGLPGVPAGWSWPVFFDEPMLFLGQIDCADLAGFEEAKALPRDGMLAFFGDYDAVTGCTGPVGLGAACYFADRDTLAPAPVPVEDLEILPSCGLRFYGTVDLPDPRSDAIERLQLAEDELEQYWNIWFEVSAQGSAEKSRYDTHVSKLFGWPDLIQRELDAIYDLKGDDEWRLLLQLGDYENGADIHSWGPGGLVYFVIDDRDLAARRFDRALLDMQCT